MQSLLQIQKLVTRFEFKIAINIAPEKFRSETPEKSNAAGE